MYLNIYCMSHKELRKLIQAGNHSLAITIPKPWIEYFKLKKGDAVEVISNSTVEIYPPKMDNENGKARMVRGARSDTKIDPIKEGHD